MRKDHQETIPFIERLLSCHLIRRKDIELTHQTGATSQITGLYGIDEEALADLDGASLQSLNLDQYLGLIFAMLQSERHLQRLLHLAIRRGDDLVSAHVSMP
nr:SapC family protein [Iodidimonas nitroreducens]